MSLDGVGNFVHGLSYFCPVSEKFDAWDKFTNRLTLSEKVIAVFFTIVATIVSAPILGMGGVAVFRAIVGKYTVRKIDTVLFDNLDGLGYLYTAKKVDNISSEIIGNKDAGQGQQQVVDGEPKNEEPKKDVILPEPPKPLSHSRNTLDDVVPDKLVLASRKIQDDGAFKNDIDAQIKKEAQADEAIQKAMKQHEEFIVTCMVGDKEIQIDQETGLISSNLYQLKTAISIAKNTFPGLTNLAFSDEHRILIARLIQIIMCGESAKTAKLPDHYCCFLVKDIIEKSAPVINCKYQYADAEEDETLLTEIFEKPEDVGKTEEEIIHAFGNQTLATALLNKLIHFSYEDESDLLAQNTKTTNVLAEDKSTLVFTHDYIIKNVSNGIQIAHCKGTESVENIRSARKVELLSDLRFSWQISEEIIDGLVGKIDQKIIDLQPVTKFEDLTEKLNNKTQRLNEFAKAEITSMEKVLLLRDDLASVGKQLEFYLLTIANLHKDKQDQGIFTSLVSLREVLATLKEKLDHVKIKFDDEKDKEEGLNLVKDLKEVIISLVGRLPRKEVQQGYFDRLTNLFKQSEDADEIAWKVKKYETMICKLREAFEANFEPDEYKSDLGVTTLGVSAFVNMGDDSRFVKKFYEMLTSVNLEKGKERYNQNYLAEIRDFYNEKFLPELRRLLPVFLKYGTKEGDHLFKICNLLFTEIVLEKECFDTINLFRQMGEGLLEPMQEGNFVERLENLYTKIDAVPYSAKAPLLYQWGNSARGQWNRDFDPYRQGNPIHVIYQLKIGAKYVKALGMGTPTAEDWNSSLTLNPEFLGMLKHYKQEGKRHLYISNQNAIPASGIAAMLNGDESPRSNALMDLQDDKNYAGTYFAIALSKNSKFYYQNGEFADQNKAEQFKKDLYSQVFELDREVSGNYIPQSIKDLIANDTDNQAKKIIEAIHKEIFNNSEVINVEDRKTFVDLFYTQLEKKIIQELDIDSFNLSCKNAIDTGAESNAELYSNTALVEDLMKEEIHQQRCESLMFARALYVRKRTPIHERFERFLNFLALGITAPREKFINLHKAIFNDVKIVPCAPDKKPTPEELAQVTPKKQIVVEVKKEEPKAEVPLPPPEKKEEQSFWTRLFG